MQKKLLEHQESKATVKNCNWQDAVMVFPVAMPERISTDRQCQQDHPNFKPGMMNDIDSKQRKAAHEQRQHGTMNSTGQSGPNAQNVPIDL